MKQEYDEVGRGYWLCPDLDKKKYSGDESGPDTEKRDPSLKEGANLLSSLCFDGQHRPVLDFDIPARYVPSTTKGHGHLYIDKPLNWENYSKLLQVLADVGILEPGYVRAALRRGATFVRPEGVKKRADSVTKLLPPRTVAPTFTPAAERKPPGSVGVGDPLEHDVITFDDPY